MASQKRDKCQLRAAVSDIKRHEELFLESQENANSLVSILEQFQSPDGAITIAATKSILNIMTRLFGTGAFSSDKRNLGTGESSLEERYKTWLQHRYHDSLRCITTILHSYTEEIQIKEFALSSLMKLLKCESYHPVIKPAKDVYVFPRRILEMVVQKLLSQELDMKGVIERFEQYLSYDDVRYYTLLHAKTITNQMRSKEHTQDLTTFCWNTFNLLDAVSMPTADEDINKYMCKRPKEDAENMKMASLKEQRKVFSHAWLMFLGLNLPGPVFKKTLVNIHESIMPHMTNPLLLTDFLSVSYNIGGAISLLALNGLFVLISEHNLEYPEFYKKLYNLFDSSIFHIKYRARFFNLAKLFLSSTYLPAYLIAAFVKRLSRLALTAPPPALLLIVTLVCNLLIQHPSCQLMVNRKDSPAEVSDDPYIMVEADPAKCRAIESSLWEISTLQAHYHPKVASMARQIHRQLPKRGLDLSEYMNLTTEEMIRWMSAKNMCKVPMEFQPPKGLFGGTNNVFTDIWSID